MASLIGICTVPLALSTHPVEFSRFLGFPFKLGADFDALGRPLLFQGFASRASRADDAEEDTGDNDKQGGAPENYEEAVGRAVGNFGRHISWSV